MKNLFILFKYLFCLVVLLVFFFVSSLSGFALEIKVIANLEESNYHKYDHWDLNTDTNRTRSEDEVEGASFSFLKDLSLGGSYGVSLIYGDLSNYDIFPKTTDFKTYFEDGYRLFLQRHIKWGWGLKLQFEKGNLKGERQPGQKSAISRFASTYVAGSFSANYELLNLVSKKPWNKRKLYLHGNFGVGYLGYRSILMYAKNNQVRNFYGFKAVDKTANISHKQLHSRLGMSKTVTMPVGVTFGVRLNHKSDLTFNVSQTTVFTDELDAWVRDWSATDKFGYFGVGFKYNFNRSVKDLPELKPKKEKKRKDKMEKQKSARLKKQIRNNLNPNQLAMLPKLPRRGFNPFRGLFRGSGVRRMKKEAEAYNAMLKVLEMQMLLLEKQYLK